MRIRSPLRVIVAAVLLMGFAGGAALAERRMALVIGDAAYSRPLQTSRQDAEDFAKSLGKMTFEPPTFLPDAELAQMRTGLKTFAAAAKSADTVLFYFAGHGVQVGNRNYLIPTKAVIRKLADVPTVALALDEVYDALAPLKAPVKLVILDACRDNPFPEIADWPKGLAKPIGAPPGTMTIFAAEPGATARDGRDDHSPFTAAVLYFMTEPGLELHSLYLAVRNSVAGATSGGQIPYQDGSPALRFYFREPASIVGEILEGDDEVLVLVNGEETMSFNSGRSTPRTISLQPGENNVVIKVFNQNTFRGACNWFRQTFEQLRPQLEILGISIPEVQNPEGWKYKVRFRPTLQDSSVIEEFADAEDIPQMNGPRHGKMFTVAKAVILVDRVTGKVSFDKTKMEREVWKHQN